ncbi:MAG TPA: LPS export ABC transporter permease LptF [Xanthomonadales bacterium]|nr:LPS export ABC transporter permease LptF [Xanthomonadales bacterium]
MRLIDRYLLRELAVAFGGVTFVLLLVTVGGTLTITLDRIARGKMPAALLLSQIGLRSLEAIALLLPLGVFLAVMLAYGRLYRDSEMAVISASGVTARGLLKPVAWLAVPVAALVAALALWLAPAALAQSDRMIDAANRSLLVVGMEPGRFVELPGRNGVVYVAEMAPDGSTFARLFVHEEHDGRVDITTAERGALYTDRDGQERYLRLDDGFRVEGEIGKPDFRTMRFARNDIQLPEASVDPDRALEKRAGLANLWTSGDAPDQAELHWRIGLPLSCLLLALLAVPLSRAQPREPRYGKVLLAVLAYVVYSNVLALGRAWLAQGSLPPLAGLWWAHAVVFAAGTWLLLGGERNPRRSA